MKLVIVNKFACKAQLFFLMPESYNVLDIVTYPACNSSALLHIQVDIGKSDHNSFLLLDNQRERGIHRRFAYVGG